MEYLPYPDLSLCRNKVRGHYFTGTDGEAKRIFRDMASALEYLEKESIIHNDIKPGNILYDRDQPPILIDFGLATACGSAACRGGTPWYIPSEYLSRRERGCKSDVFALGVTMLYLLRKIPLPDATEQNWRLGKIHELPQATLMGKWLDKVHQISGQLSNSSRSMESIVRAMLVDDPDERVSAAEILERFKRIG